MKIESINENQIRCTLTLNDLIGHEVRLSELAYGSAKARELFQEVLAQAHDEVGFSVDNMPLMVEAVPISEECLMIIITKVEDPEELDTRFSRFTPEPDSDEDEDDDDDDEDENSNSNTQQSDLYDIVHKLEQDVIDKHTAQPEAKDSKDTGDQAPHSRRYTRIYSFASLDLVSTLAAQLGSDFSCSSTLYKSPRNNRCYLTITEGPDNQNDFRLACGLAAEFGRRERASGNTLYYYEEHYRKLIDGNALQVLRKIG